MQQCLFAAIGIAPGDSPILIAVFGVLGGVGMGLTVGLVTGLFLVRLLDRAKPAVSHR
jgi:NhaP-type Na+/H+ or K+/H+ antiporter